WLRIGSTFASPGEFVDQQNLVARVLAGDQQAERELYDANVDRVYRLVYRMVGEGELAADYTQETFIRTFERLASFRGEAALSTWISAIAISVVYNGQRKVRRLRSREVELTHAEPVAAAERRADPDLRLKLNAAIDALPEGYRTVFLMHDVEGYTHEEIGAALGIQDGTSKAQLSRARAKLRRQLAAYAGNLAS
ncbi:MAG TPA: sigma-70 family RNA polymerase sigma factor, partial [Gemmatimonadales bacterium]|nr:sigma-70 family RNA polymerase sigma factor [Gemmatimonadales bacterium]